MAICDDRHSQSAICCLGVMGVSWLLSL